MTNNPRILFLNGSPKGKNSASEQLATYMLNRLKERGCEIQLIQIISSIKSEDKFNELLVIFDSSDIIGLIFPLYIDSLPTPLIETLERLSDFTVKSGNTSKKKLFALCNSGFPESSQINTALEICRKFTAETGMGWLGGLALGMGGAIGIRPLEKSGRITRNVIGSLDLSINSIIKGEPLPQKAIDLMAKPTIPKWLYTIIGNYGMRREAKKYKASADLYARPYK